ncbi:hypothetical protein J2810_004875 [Chryseobacterium rhizosphaerae]|jgi:hypothetical protein|uniref:hypothetical protein n=1 Tax=Chryseobacterium rhizosphaerae TaxID=395937 RepID=UPI000645E532|nr:hypothetical protein [Chryseobacterium rhizosphaerae]MDR6548782.1 hypothetical protein [Chryseobacterium rhizosphaerae]
MYNEKLERLIELALADGELTEKEKQVLFKNAEAEGIDLDEFEIVLEARLFEKTNDKNSQSAAPHSDKLGDVRKCPACGAIAESFSTCCSDCGFNFNNVEANVSIQKLFHMINELESRRNEESNNPLRLLGNAIISKSFRIGIGDRINHQKKELISNFPIANTKNDILEFLSLALPKAKKAGNFFTSGSFNTAANERNRIHNEFVPVWRAKCEQIIMKARFSMKEDRRTLEEVENYASQLKIK